jgi:adenylate cyclase
MRDEKGVVGTVGQRMTAIGDAVNFASRIESANKEYGTELLISEDVYHQVAGKLPSPAQSKTLS